MMTIRAPYCVSASVSDSEEALHMQTLWSDTLFKREHILLHTYVCFLINKPGQLMYFATFVAQQKTWFGSMLCRQKKKHEDDYSQKLLSSKTLSLNWECARIPFSCSPAKSMQCIAPTEL